MNNTQDKLKEYLIRPAVVGLTTSVLSAIVFGESSDGVRFMGMNVPTYALTFGAGFSSSIISNLSSDYVLSKLGGSKNVQMVESALVGPALNGLAMGGILYLGDIVDLADIWKPIALGAASEGFGVYLSDNFI